MDRYKYSLDKIARDCILDTEKKVRDVVAKVMIRLHGPDWEKKRSVGFSKDEIRNLEQRSKDESDKLLSQPLSWRLLDYSHILDLKRVILDNWSDFAQIFPSRDTTMLYFDILNNFRNPIVHVRPGVLEHQHHLILGVCGELRLYIDRWMVGYRHSVTSYYCEFRFPFFGRNEDELKDGRAKAESKAYEWSKRIQSLSSKVVEFRTSNDLGEEKLIRLPKGQVQISVPKTVYQDDGVSYWASIIRAKVSTKSALSEVLIKGEHPCWFLQWTLKEDIDVHTLVSEIKDLTGLTPSSSSGLNTATSSKEVSVEYSVQVDDNEKVRIFLGSSGYSGGSPAVGLIPVRSRDAGFFLAHEILSPDSILSFLRGEIGRRKFRAMLQQARGADNLP